MPVDFSRIDKYLDQIICETEEIKLILQQPNAEIKQSPHLLRSLKYSIIVISEAIANTLQHILAKKYREAVSGYKEVFIKANEHQIISSKLFQRLQPFISFRNMLVHQYWRVDDDIFLKNIRDGLLDFQKFIREINQTRGMR